MTTARVPGSQPGLAGRIGRFFQWWKTGLVGCIPDSLVARLFSSQESWRLVIEDSGARVESLSFDGQIVDRFTLAGPEDLDRLKERIDDKVQPEIRLPEDWVLQKTVMLPAAAVKNIRQVLSYELDRLTPFTSNDVYFDYAVDAESGKEGHVKVHLALIQRLLLDRWVDTLIRMKIRPSSVTAEGLWQGFDLGHSIDRLQAQAGSNRNYIRLALASGVVILTIAVFITPLWQKRMAAAKLNDSLEQAKRRAEVVLELKNRIEETESALNYVTDQRKQQVPVIRVLDHITRLLPDDTWVQQLELKGDMIELRGESRQATRLIKLFEDSPSFTEAAFRSPVVQAHDSERYHVAARMMVSGIE